MEISEFHHVPKPENITELINGVTLKMQPLKLDYSDNLC